MNLTVTSDKYQDAVKFYYEGNVKEAEDLLIELLENNSLDYDVLNFLGVIKLQQENYSDASSFFERVISLCSYHQEACYNLGLCYQKLGDHYKAQANYEKVLVFNPSHFDAINNLGVIYLNRKEYTQAESCFHFCLSLKPDSAAVFNNLGSINLELGKTAEGLSCYIKAVELEPRNAVFNYNLGTAFMKSGSNTEAIQYFETAVAINPEYDEAYNSLAIIFTKQSDFKKAEEYLLKVRNNTLSKALLAANKGVAKLLQGLVHEALDLFNEALVYEPEHPEIHYNKSHALLILGRYEEGWGEYEWRMKKEEFKGSELLKPLPDSLDIKGLRIIIRDEQGLGDSIQFVRYIPMLKDKGAYTIFQCSGRLIPLCTHIKGIDELYPREEPLPEIKYDYEISLLSLPKYFKTKLDSIPADVPYISSEKEYDEKWKKYFSRSSAYKVGIVWAGNPNHTGDKRRSCRLASFIPLFDIEGVEFYTLQKGAAVNQTKDFLYPLNVLDEYDASFLDTASIINQLDLVITVDTSIAHLAGAMGKETWVLLPFLPDWRWFLERSDVPWYPTAKLFRQDSPDNWSSVFVKVKDELQKIIKKKEKNMNESPRNYNKIESYFDEIERHIYPEPVSNIHSEITSGVIKKLIEIFQFPKDINILDIGCGQGPALEAFSSYGFSPTGITLGEEDVNICRQKGFPVLKMDQTFLGFEDNTFDLIWARHVLEHSVMPLFTLMEYRRVTKNGGLIYIEVPGAGTSAHHEENPNHYSVLSQRMWLSLLSKAGLTVLENFDIPLDLQCGKDEYWGFICKCEKEIVNKNIADQKIYLALSQGENYGWGVCSKYIKKELSRKINIEDINENKELLQRGRVPGKVFHALANLNFDSLFNIRGDVNIGYTFLKMSLMINQYRIQQSMTLSLPAQTGANIRWKLKELKTRVF